MRRRRPARFRSHLYTAVAIALTSSIMIVLSACDPTPPEGAENTAQIVDSSAEKMGASEALDIELKLPPFDEDKGKLCNGWPRQPCNFNVVFESFTNIEGPAGDNSGEYGFVLRAGGTRITAPESTSGEFYHYVSLDEGDTRSVELLLSSHIVGCGESKVIPYQILADEADNGLASWSEKGTASGSLVLTCTPETKAEVTTAHLELVNNNDKVKHKVDVRLRTEVANEDHCGDVGVDAPLSAGSCDIEIQLDRIDHSSQSHGSPPLRFETSAGGEVATLPGIDTVYFIPQGGTETVEAPLSTFHLGCGERRTIPIHVKGRANEGIDDIGEASGSFEISCPMDNTEVKVPLVLYGKVSGKARHWLSVYYTARDVGWSAFSMEGRNMCCQKARCKSECPVMGSYDGANCFVAEAPPPPAQPFLWSDDPLVEGMYYTPVDGNQCTVGSFDGANCHVASVPTDRATPFIYNRNLYVEACDGACPRACAIGTWDGARCVVGTAPGGTPFIWDQAFHYTPLSDDPATRCPLGGWDGANCYVAAIPQYAEGYIEGNQFLVKPCQL